MTYHILPSLLAADLLSLGEDIQQVIQAGVDMIHLDIMDNHYVPNLSFGPGVCQAIHERFASLAIDVHLMTTPVDNLIQNFASAGATRLSIHPDATIHLDRSLALIRDLGCHAGLVLNPATSLDCLQWCAHRLDFILIMTVNPGFGGQQLITDVIKKIELVNQRYPELPICIDGGVTVANVQALAKAGASQFVAGSTVFNSPDYAKTITALRAACEH